MSKIEVAKIEAPDPVASNERHVAWATFGFDGFLSDSEKPRLERVNDDTRRQVAEFVTKITPDSLITIIERPREITVWYWAGK